MTQTAVFGDRILIASGNASADEARQALTDDGRPVGDLIQQWHEDDLDWFEFAIA